MRDLRKIPGRRMMAALRSALAIASAVLMPMVLMPMVVMSAPLMSAVGVTASWLSLLPVPAAAAGRDGEMVIIDTDIGDDISDALAVGLALSSPELKVLGITSSLGDTALRARLLDRIVRDAGCPAITVAAGAARHRRGEADFTQARFAAAEPARPHPAAVDFLLEEIRRHPDDITVIALAPLSNLGAAFERDPHTFRKLKRIVMMGGSIHRGYDAGGGHRRGPDAEYNVAMDVAAARAVLASGVPLHVIPLDAARQRLDAAGRRAIFTSDTRLGADLSTLYREWAEASRRRTPVLYDPLAVAHAIDPELCPASPMRLTIDGRGFTRRRSGPPNSLACLRADNGRLLDFYMLRLKRAALAACPAPP